MLTDPERVTAAFEAGLEVEALGWKGAQASAMKSRPETAAFMRNVVRRFAARGLVRMVTLTAADRQVAFLLGFAHKGCLYFHKTGFDPEWEATSPGRLVLLKSIEAAFEEGFSAMTSWARPTPTSCSAAPPCAPTRRCSSTTTACAPGCSGR